MLALFNSFLGKVMDFLVFLQKTLYKPTGFRWSNSQTSSKTVFTLCTNCKPEDHLDIASYKYQDGTVYQLVEYYYANYFTKLDRSHTQRFCSSKACKYWFKFNLTCFLQCAQTKHRTECLVQFGSNSTETIFILY